MQHAEQIETLIIESTKPIAVPTRKSLNKLYSSHARCSIAPKSLTCCSLAGMTEQGQKAKEGAAREATSATTTPNSPQTDLPTAGQKPVQPVEAAKPAQAPPADAVMTAPEKKVDTAKLIEAAMAKIPLTGKEIYIRAIPQIQMNLRYRPMESITKAPHFIKHVPPVYSDALNFDFADRDYQLVQRDKQFVADINAKIAAGNGELRNTKNQGMPFKQSPITEDEFEAFIDVTEKIYQRIKSKTEENLRDSFMSLADEALKKKITPQFLCQYLIPYWRMGKRFTRKFWENPDSNDPDTSAAFKKRNDPGRMTLRHKHQSLQHKLKRKR